MENAIKNMITAIKPVLKGGKLYYAWIGLLGLFILIGAGAYYQQFDQGLAVTAMRDQVSWGFYISNFTFLVGVAAAAVLLVVPAYLYDFKPIKEIVLFGELMAIAAVTMCIMFVTVDMGRPDRLWHVIPFIGKMNWPSSLLAWDIIVLNGYLVINASVVFYVLYQKAHKGTYDQKVIMPLILLSIPWAVSIHTVTAFLFNGVSARPYWNASILAPRFLASAFASGPALMIIVFQIIRKFTPIEIDNRALRKIAQLIAYTLAINLFLFGAEVFKEFYSGSMHLAPMQYMYFGLHGNDTLVPFMWTGFFLNLIAFFLFLFPKTRDNITTLNVAAVFVITGVYIEKGLGLAVPGFIPGTLGEIYNYVPSSIELLVTLGVWATGAMIYTLLVKFAVPIYTGEVKFYKDEAAS
jgi:molybdopterin-containing oxidoreductase family membrane subunit